jgi:hypothetical protein
MTDQSTYFELQSSLGKSVPPAFLYHYTSQDGLIGIFSNNEIWASKIRYTNDSSEFIQSLKYVKSELNKELELAAKDLKEELLFLLDSIDHVDSVNICICSFTTDGDLLSQWRAYSGNGVGYSIGFDGPTLAMAARNESFILAKCIYDQEIQETRLDEFVGRTLEQLKSGKYNIEAIVNELCLLASVMKNEKFQEEEEWRLLSEPLSVKRDRFKFRSGKATIIPYYCIPLNEENAIVKIREVVCGPSECVDLVKSSVTQLLMKYGYYDFATKPVNIHSSEIPYRRW